MKSYDLLVFHAPEGWRRFALLPYTLGFRLVSVIAEESALAYVAPIRVCVGSEVVMELGQPISSEKAA